MEAIIDYRGKTPKKVDKGIPLITAKIVKDGRVLEPAEFIAESDYESWMVRGLPKRGDVVVTSEAPLGEVAQLTDAYVALAQRIVTLRGKRGILNNDYLLCAMQSSYVQNQLESRASGSTVKGIKQSELRKVLLPIPPENEQIEIANHIKTLSNKIELNCQTNQTLEQIAQAIFKSWFVDFEPVKAKMAAKQAGASAEQIEQAAICAISGKTPEQLAQLDPQTLQQLKATAALFPDALVDSELGEIPEGWEATGLGNEIDFATGFAFKSAEFSNSGTRLARGDNVKEGSFYWGDKTRYWSVITPDIEKYLLKSGDILIGMDGSKVGKNWVRVSDSDLPCLLVQRVARLRTSGTIGSSMLEVLIGGFDFKQYVENIKTGTSIPHISGKQIKDFPVIKPNDDGLLFNAYEKLLAPMASWREKNLSENLSLSALRDSLLPKLLSGEITLANQIRRLG